MNIEEKTKHLSKPQAKGDDPNCFTIVEVAEVGFWSIFSPPKEPPIDDGKRRLWYVAGVEDGKIFMSPDSLGNNHENAQYIECTRGIPLQNLCDYKSYKSQS